MALFILAIYFATRYLYDTLLKIAAGCHNPFNPMYCYRDYPTWAKGYNRGRSEMLKAVKKIIAEFGTDGIERGEQFLCVDRYFRSASKHPSADQ
ncbi:hypothetical protein, partial [Pseudomonas putida]|uniref:hypothetical protein n=1 Tax=Pseudomonas putida TaxID=303 RepID=UPI001F52136A